MSTLKSKAFVYRLCIKCVKLCNCIGLWFLLKYLSRLPGCEEGTVTSSPWEKKPSSPIREYPPSILHQVSFMVIRLTKMIITWHALAAGDLETWTLRIRGARETDRGGYECQVNILITIIGAIIINHHVRWTDRIFPRFFTAFIKIGFLLIPYIGAHTSYL